ncbi:MAG: hypothetical protein WCB22_29650, partial [Pseudolabrys sp.]
ELNGHPIEIVALHLTSLQRHRKSPIVRGQLADGSVVAPMKEMANPALIITRGRLIAISHQHQAGER